MGCLAVKEHPALKQTNKRDVRFSSKSSWITSNKKPFGLFTSSHFKRNADSNLIVKKTDMFYRHIHTFVMYKFSWTRLEAMESYKRGTTVTRVRQCSRREYKWVWGEPGKVIIYLLYIHFNMSHLLNLFWTDGSVNANINCPCGKNVLILNILHLKNNANKCMVPHFSTKSHTLTRHH